MGRSSGHRKAQKLGKIRDDFTCAVCGVRIPPEEAYHIHRVEGHHIIHHSDGGPDALENIITLCYDCHLAYHAGELDLDISGF